MLRIERRTATFGGGMSTRTEKHGDEDVIACDLSVAMRLPGGRALANLLIGETAEHLLWTDNGGGVLDVRFSTIGPIALAEKIESVKVDIWPRGLKDGKVTFADANLARVKLKPLPGGVLELTFQLQARPEEDEFDQLADCLNRDVEVELFCKEFRSQAKLPLDTKASEEAPPKRKRGPAQHELNG